MKTRTQSIVVIIAVSLLLSGCGRSTSENKSGDKLPLRVAISPYQDLAMLTAAKNLKLEEKYGTRIEIVTLDWETVQPALASAGKTVDVGFGSLIEFLTKYENLNPAGSDPLVFVYPTYVFKGGGFITFNSRVPNLDETGVSDKEALRNFFNFQIGAQKNSMFDMMIFHLAKNANVAPNTLKIKDITMTDGLLLAQNGALDVAAAGLTQRNEALEKGGKIVLTMEKLGFADLTGLICRKSTLDARRKDIEALVRIWFDCVDYVYRDLPKNSAIPIEYLNKKSSTQYTPETYARALEAEYLPRTLEAANRDLIAPDGKFSISKISQTVGSYLTTMQIVKTQPPTPDPISIK